MIIIHNHQLSVCLMNNFWHKNIGDSQLVLSVLRTIHHIWDGGCKSCQQNISTHLKHAAPALLFSDLFVRDGENSFTLLATTNQFYPSQP